MSAETLSEQVKSYRINDEGRDEVRLSRIAFLSGIIGAGKDSSKKILLTAPEYAGRYQAIVTDTTRDPRVNNGKAEMLGRVESHMMVEVNQFGDKFYGTRIEEFRSATNLGKIALGDIDVNGVKNFKEIAPDSTTAIFLVPPDFQTWHDRMLARYKTPEEFYEVWGKRRSITIQELEIALKEPYYHFVINDDLERAVSVIDKIAHREYDFFKRADDEARLVARDLLEAIERTA